MASALLIRLIEGASDSLARTIYRRILDDRRAAKGRVLSSDASATWEQILASAMDERVLDPVDAAALLAEMCDEPATSALCIARDRGRRRAASQVGAGRHPRSVRRRDS